MKEFKVEFTIRIKFLYPSVHCVSKLHHLPNVSCVRTEVVRSQCSDATIGDDYTRQCDDYVASESETHT